MHFQEKVGDMLCFLFSITDIITSGMNIDI